MYIANGQRMCEFVEEFILGECEELAELVFDNTYYNLAASQRYLLWIGVIARWDLVIV
jgi:hypothetical protein